MTAAALHILTPPVIALATLTVTGMLVSAACVCACVGTAIVVALWRTARGVWGR